MEKGIKHDFYCVRLFVVVVVVSWEVVSSIYVQLYEDVLWIWENEKSDFSYKQIIITSVRTLHICSMEGTLSLSFRL